MTQEFFEAAPRRRWGVGVGPHALVVVSALLMGVVAGAAVAFGPWWLGFAALLAGGAALAVLRSVRAALLAVIVVIVVLPFGTLPVKIAVTPTLLELALLALLGVWLARLLVVPDYELRGSPLGGGVLLWLGLTVFSLLLGANGLPDNLTLHNYVKFVLGVLLFFSILNAARTTSDLRWLVRGLVAGGAAAAVGGIALRLLNDATALNALTALGRLGYPTEGRVLRYIADDPAGVERAIGTAVDPNSFGGMLSVLCALTLTQWWARRPVFPRWVIAGSVLVMGLCVFLTFSRAAMFGLIAAAMFIATVRERRLWWVLLALAGAAGVAYLGFGVGDGVVTRFVEGVQFQDEAQQMRLAEFRNAIIIIQRYPVFGVGFAGGPELGLITGVSSIYLAMGERIGLVGLGVFAALMAGFFLVTFRRHRHLDHERQSWVLGAQAGIVAALVGGLADHYFFNIEFSHMVALFWAIVGLGIAAAGEAGHGDIGAD